MSALVDWEAAAAALVDARGRSKAGALPKPENIAAIDAVLEIQRPREAAASRGVPWNEWWSAFALRHQPASAAVPLPPEDAPVPPPAKHEPREPGEDG